MSDVKRRLRILFVTSDKYPPFRPAARAIFSEELASRGHIIDWLMPAASGYNGPHRIPYGNGTAYIARTDQGVSIWSRFRKHISDILNDFRMFRLIREQRYDLIQVKDKYIAALLAIIACRYGNTRFVYWLAYPHAEANLYQVDEGIARYQYLYLLRGQFFRYVLYKAILPSAEHIFVQSEQMKRDISLEGIPLEKMTPVPGSISLDDIPYYVRPIPEATHSPGAPVVDERRVLYLGTLTRARRLDFLVRVHAIVMRSHPNTKLYLIGKGPMREDELTLINEANRLGILDSLVFTGHLPMNEAWEYIRYADVCVSPYYPTPILNSTSPTKLIEYMAMGKAVVGNDHPEQSQVIAESGAGLCVSWDETRFAEAIIRILDNTEEACDMGIRGRTYVENNRTNRIMASIIEAQYIRICEGSKADTIKVNNKIR